MENKKPIKKYHMKEFVVGMPWDRAGDKFGTSHGPPGTFGLIYVEIHIQEAECPRDRWRDRWDMSTGQMGHKPGGVPPCEKLGPLQNRKTPPQTK